MKIFAYLTSLAVAFANDAARFDAERAAMINAINSDPNSLWTAIAHPRFQGMPLGAVKPLCGVDIPAYHVRLAAARASGKHEVRNATMSADAIPASFDSEANWPNCAKVIGDIRDQSNCGCCWAFGAASAASDRLCISTNGTVALPLSAQDMCFCGSSSGCDGGFPEGAWDTISRKGLVTGGQNKGIGPFGKDGYCSAFSLPHCHHHGPVGNDPYPSEGANGCPSVNRSPECPRKCDADATAPHNNFEQDKYKFKGGVSQYRNVQALQESIMTYGPTETAFTVYKDFENYAGGIYKRTSSQTLGGHAVRIVGWGEDSGTKYWKVANSWNPFWGEKGYFRIVLGSDECGIESGAVASSDKATWVTPQ